MTNLKYISSFIIFGQTWGIKWTVPSDFLAKKKQLIFYDGLWPIAASIKEGILLLRSTIVVTRAVILRVYRDIKEGNKIIYIRLGISKIY